VAKLELARHEIEDLVRSRAWRLLVATAVEHTSALSEQNNQIDPFKEPTQLCRNQGEIAGVGFLIDLPAIWAEQLEYEKKVEKEEKEDGK
jgi:hypothetical protein